MSKDNRHDGRRRGAGQHRLGPRISQGGDGRERSGSNSSGSSHGGGKTKNGSLTSLKASFQRSNSHDKVRKIVAEEGRAARNLIAWSVPLENKEEEVKSKGNSSSSSRFQRTNSGQQKNKKQNAGVDIKGTAGALLDKGPEKSPTKVRQPRKVDLRARYWAFLFENLRRAVDEIYVTCESDQSVLECKEVLMMLDNYVRDFKALIDWIQLQEKLEKTDAQNRPTSLAWEVRKMSPGRHVMQSPTSDRVVPSPGARRALNFGGPPSTLAAARLSHTGPSWADRVKCTKSDNSPNQPSASPAEKPGKKDAEGWETVQRGRTAKPRSAAIVAKVSPVVAQVSPKQDSAKCNRSLVVPQEEQHPRSERPSVKEVIQADTGQQVSVEPDPLVKVEHPDNEGIMEPPAENVQDSGQCVNATCEDEPPPIASLTPSQASEGIPSAPTFPPPDTAVFLAVPSVDITSATDLPQKEGISSLASCGDTGAEGGASQGMATSAPGQAETPMAVVKLESVLDPTELSTVSAERWRSSRREGLRGQETPRVPHRLNKVDFRKPQDQKRGRAAELYVVLL